MHVLKEKAARGSCAPQGDLSSTGIVFIPAIGADARKTWERTPERAETEGTQRLDLCVLDRLRFTAQVHLYDHLTRKERSVEVPKIKKPLAEPQQAVYNEYLQTGNQVAAYGVNDWADRFLECMRTHRQSRDVVDRPIIFICHSTGGNVLKAALTKKSGTDVNEIASNTIAITFFGVPHHGSSVISGNSYERAVQNKLNLKWPMSKRLRQDFQIHENEGLELLNHRFAVDIVGVKIHSYAETADTILDLLTVARGGGEQSTTFRLCIVDSRSGKLGTAQVPVEDEESMQLDLTHVELPRFYEQDGQLESYLTAIEELVKGYDAKDQREYQMLKNKIMKDVNIHIHQFYGDPNSMRVILAKPTLEDFLKDGPDKTMMRRLDNQDTDLPGTAEMERRPTIGFTPASEQSVPVVPNVQINGPIDDDAHSNHESHSKSMLAPPPVPSPRSIHTQRPPKIDGPESSNGVPPQVKAVRFATGHGNENKPATAATVQLPAQGSERFRWIHVPFTYPGWVHQVLGTISEDKSNLKLHQQLLLDKIWLGQHNQSRHASPHARFVRPSVKALYPEGAKESDALAMPSSSCDSVQLVAYMPYLHWDSFKSMKERANVINRRLDQPQARPIPRDITLGNSLEHKLIWQFLTLDRPLHCRRTLDQYGYPSLRNTIVRDHDQILWKRTRLELQRTPSSLSNSTTAKAKKPPKPMDIQPNVVGTESHIPKVLMVDQLWMWIVDDATVVTFFPGRENDNHTGCSREGDVRSLIYQDINGDFANQCDDPYDFAALAVRHAIRALLAKTTDRNLQAFRIFEEYISILTEKQNKSWKDFRNNQNLKIEDMETEKHVNNREDLNSLLELRDIEDELNTIDKLIREQQSVVGDMTIRYEELNRAGKGLKGKEFLADITQFLSEHKVQIDSMRDSTQAAKKAYTELLDMKQKQANVMEARLAGKQSTTVSSCLDLYLHHHHLLAAFLFASVFGINAKEWSGDGTHYMRLHDIFLYMIMLSLAVITIALLAAFSKPARRLAMRSWHWIGIRYQTLFPSKAQTRVDDEMTVDNFNYDVERYGADTNEKYHNSRLSTVSRTQTALHLDEKYESDMERKRNGSVKWLSNGFGH
ncbi:uncharacterized protein KY384_007167 [Bacidia gigantensis]|uniref:uncharacterized protein n=1 Tax=Bacidia gigantensis TaxID=2732470 RepID=UPI001D035F95|nr:uncharacterized protein KY384_007167 [Bacidia gigantensis]KAG8528250.1 hypothetical protein KY384_007167 [Bacidia gigantensis]